MSALIHKIDIPLPMTVMARKHIERFPVKFTATADVIEKPTIFDKKTTSWFDMATANIMVDINGHVLKNRLPDVGFDDVVDTGISFEEVPFLSFPREFLIMSRKHRYGLLVFYAMRSDIWKFFGQNLSYRPQVRYVWNDFMKVSHAGRDDMFKSINTSAFMEIAAKHQRLCLKYENMDAAKRISANITSVGGFLPY